MAASPSFMQTQLGTPDTGGAATWQQYMQAAIPPPLPSSPDTSSDDPDLGDSTGDIGDASDPTSGAQTSSQIDDKTADKLESDLTALQKRENARMAAANTDDPAAEQAVQSDIAQAKEDAAFARQLEKRELSDIDSNEEQQDRIYAAEIANLQQQPPAPPEQNANPLQRLAPLLMMAALGGKAAKLDANAMLGASIGTVQGFLAGDQQKYENSTKAYDEALKRFQDRQDQQEKIYEQMKKSYAGHVDGDLKALQAAHEMTGDDKAITQADVEALQHRQAAATALAKTDNAMDKAMYDERAKIEMARKKDAAAADKAKAAAAKTTQTSGTLSPKANQLGASLAAAGISLPTGTRSAAARAQTLQGLIDKYPNMTPDQIAQQVKSGQVSMTASRTEATQVARREGNIEASATALTEQGGLYDQLLSAADKVNLGDSKTANAVRIGMQQHVYANPDIQRYVTVLEDTRADLTNVLARTGQATETVRAQANNMFPDTMSVSELKAAIDASKKVTSAVMAGNQAVMDAIKNGYSVEHASTLVGTAAPKATVSADTLQAYASKHKMSVDAAKKFLISQGYQVP